MSRRYSRDPLGDVVGGMVMTGVVVAGFIAIAAGMTIAKLFHTPIEEKLRRLTPHEPWGVLISSRSCPQCQTRTEAEAGHCLICGYRLL